MEKLEADGSNRNYYLPKGMPLVNPFRMQHGKVRWEGEAIKALTWLPDILHETLDDKGRELLSRDYVHICETVQRIVISAKQCLGLSDLRGYIGAQGLSTLPLPQSDPFVALLSKLMPYQSNLVLWVVCDDYNRGNVALAEKLITSICNSLDLAKKVIDECRPKD